MEHTTTRYTATPFSIIYFLMDLITGFLGLRFLFKLLGANAGHWLVQMLYAITDPLVAPFRGMFEGVAYQNLLFEWNALVAIAAYSIIGILIVRSLDALTAALITAEEDHVHHHAHHRRHRHA